MKNYFLKFIHSEQAGGFILLLCTIIALMIANSEIAQYYFALWDIKIGFIGNDYVFQKTLKHWVDDGLMSIFFLLVGLEIKREFISGELSSAQKAILPAMAAIGGMLVPALIFVFYNAGTPTVDGWGIPMATDIAFSLAVLSLIKGVPNSLRIFLVALAVADDIGAIIVIAVFYSETIHLIYFAGAIVVIALLLFMNKKKVFKLSWYLILGILLWLLVLKTGIHTTIAGVILAFTIPFNTEKENSPLHKLESVLHTPVNFFVLPLFALANTGIVIQSVNFFAGLQSNESLGIILGLVVGKPIGILGAVLLAMAFKIAKIPEGTNLWQFLGIGFICGIGYTMSIFIAGLAYSNPAIIDSSKIAVLTASLIAAIAGFLFVYLTTHSKDTKDDLIAASSEE
jgi:NhaA family Na+:H+ antiporter